ncbi:TRAP transporter large permease [Vreelandella lionensis]|uniref:TRAP transporter large permease protein n=1 Tax=Vreelandella lionensis TaxID=1144478 RepID=A0ABW8BW15_9GAMM
MDSTSIFLWLLGAFGFLLAIGAPVFAALGVSSILGMYFIGGSSSLMTIPSILYRGMTSYSLIAIPLFILMGEVIARTNLGGRLFTLFYLWLHRLPGSLAMASVGSSAVFGAMSGVSVAGAATIGRFAIPEMIKRNYSPSLAGGSVAAAGALALLIPPSIGFILYGEIANQSIGRLFIAAIIPGIMVAILMVIYIGLLAIIHPASAPRIKVQVTWTQRFKALKDIWAAMVLVLLVLGSIYLGVATPTEAAGLGAIGAFAIAALYRQLELPTFFDIIRSTAVTSGMILLILAAALLFGWVITRLMIPQELVMWISGMDVPAWTIFLMILLFLLVIGMFLDIVSIILIATPIVLPVIEQLGFSPIWFGVVMIITCEMAVITPPIGLNLYVIKGVAPNISLADIINGALPFVLVEAFAILLLILFPSIALWLPNFMW